MTHCRWSWQVCFLQDNGGGGAEPMGRGDTITYKADPEKIEPIRLGELQAEMIPPRTRDGKPTRQGRGVMPGPADTFLGYGLSWAKRALVKDGKPFFAKRHAGKMTLLTGTSSLPPGPSVIRVKLAVSGKTTVEVNGAEVARAKAPGPIAMPVDGLTVGRDGGDPVGPYAGPEAFQGRLERLAIRLGG